MTPRPLWAAALVVLVLCTSSQARKLKFGSDVENQTGELSTCQRTGIQRATFELSLAGPLPPADAPAADGSLPAPAPSEQPAMGQYTLVWNPCLNTSAAAMEDIIRESLPLLVLLPALGVPVAAYEPTMALLADQGFVVVAATTELALPPNTTAASYRGALPDCPSYQGGGSAGLVSTLEEAVNGGGLADQYPALGIMVQQGLGMVLLGHLEGAAAAIAPFTGQCYDPEGLDADTSYLCSSYKATRAKIRGVIALDPVLGDRPYIPDFSNVPNNRFLLVGSTQQPADAAADASTAGQQILDRATGRGCLLSFTVEPGASLLGLPAASNSTAAASPLGAAPAPGPTAGGACERTLPVLPTAADIAAGSAVDSPVLISELAAATLKSLLFMDSVYWRDWLQTGLPEEAGVVSANMENHWCFMSYAVGK